MEGKAIHVNFLELDGSSRRTTESSMGRVGEKEPGKGTLKPLWAGIMDLRGMELQNTLHSGSLWCGSRFFIF